MNKRFITHGLAVIGIAALAFLSIASGATRAASTASGALSADDYFQRGVEAFDNADYDQAITEFTQAIRLDPNEPGAYNNRGVAYVEKEDYAHAIADFEAAIRIYPGYTDAKNNLASARQTAARQGQNNQTQATQQVLAQANSGTGSTQQAAANVPGTVTWNGKEVTWIEAVNGIRNGGNDKKHTITVSGIVSIPITPASETTFGGVTGLELTIEGIGTLTRSGGSSGNLLRIGAGQQVILNDLTLRGGGITLNGKGAQCVLLNAAMNGDGVTSGDGITVNNYGVLIMFGNTNTVSGYEGIGVSISNRGHFTMVGGTTISDNAGGGVSVDHGVFKMEEGTISGNTSFGVRISRSYNATIDEIPKMVADERVIEHLNGRQVIIPTLFVMEGGSISGNNGHGVMLDGGFFKMKGGTISGNRITQDNAGYNTDYTRASPNGSGVYVTGSYMWRIGDESFTTQGTFIMNGGTISGNRAQNNGGGVYVTGRFLMEGGTIAGNTASNGGGIYIDSRGLLTGGNGAFAKTGGTIYGNNEPDARLRNSASSRQGHAVAARDNWRNATAGPNMNHDSYGFWLNETN